MLCCHASLDFITNKGEPLKDFRKKNSIFVWIRALERSIRLLREGTFNGNPTHGETRQRRDSWLLPKEEVVVVIPRPIEKQREKGIIEKDIKGLGR